jgi:hypothetical protein
LPCYQTNSIDIESSFDGQSKCPAISPRENPPLSCKAFYCNRSFIIIRSYLALLSQYAIFGPSHRSKYDNSKIQGCGVLCGLEQITRCQNNSCACNCRCGGWWRLLFSFFKLERFGRTLSSHCLVHALRARKTRNRWTVIRYVNDTLKGSWVFPPKKCYKRCLQLSTPLTGLFLFHRLQKCILNRTVCTKLREPLHARSCSRVLSLRAIKLPKIVEKYYGYMTCRGGGYDWARMLFLLGKWLTFSAFVKHIG